MTRHLFYIATSYSLTLGAAFSLGLACAWRLRRAKRALCLHQTRPVTLSQDERVS